MHSKSNGLKKFYYEIAQDKKLSVGYIECKSNVEATQRFKGEMKNGTLLFLQNQRGVILFEKKGG